MKTILAAVNAKYIHSNLAVYSLRAYAKDYLSETKIAEYTINQQIDEILMDLYREQPELLCFSCYIWNLDYVEELVREIKKILPETIIWETFAALLDFYHGKTERLDETAGITFRKEDGEIRENTWREVMDLSLVPFVYEDLSLFEHKIIYYETSRGCPFRCSYCLSSVDKCLRFRDLDLVKRELQYFLDQKVPQVKFVDRTFNCRHGHAKEIWKYLLEHDNGITNFHFEVSADLLNEEELELISRMRPGLIQLEIGVQSTNPDTIREIKRTMNFERLSEVVKKIKAMGNTHQHLDLIAGLPYEGYESFGQSFDDVYGLMPDQLQLGFLKVLKGSYMQEHAEEYGLVYKGKPPYEVLGTSWLSYGEIAQLKKIEEMVEVYYNSGQFANTLRFLVKEFASPFRMYEKLSGYYEEKGLFGRSHTRTARYEILLDFIGENVKGKTKFYRELLVYDLYLRENIKSRPEFAGESLADKEFLKAFYDREEKEPVYLKSYEKADSRKLRKMTHIEVFEFQVDRDMEPGKTVLLFDYQNRNPLNYEAAVFRIGEKEE